MLRSGVGASLLFVKGNDSSVSDGFALLGRQGDKRH